MITVRAQAQTMPKPRAKTQPPQGDDLFWQATLRRDAAFDGAFVYGVTSTGIYCRPSCPSRRPRRGNVSFFATPEEAEANGLRSCLRCNPRDGVAPNPTRDKVLAACAYLARGHQRVPTLKELGRHVGLSPSHLQRTFKRLVGVSPWQYGDALRLERFKGELAAGEGITGALYGAGYGSSSRLYEQAAARLGMTPGAYRKGGAGRRIRYAVARCDLGQLLVAATDEGICAVRLGSSARELRQGLLGEFAEAEVEHGGREVERWLEALLSFVDHGSALPDLPRDVRATAFQRKVWEAIRAIPAGETATYSELATAIGRPGAARAVARACAGNPLALLVPCHRVVPKSGGGGGYRWGRERKAALLERERSGA